MKTYVTLIITVIACCDFLYSDTVTIENTTTGDEIPLLSDEYLETLKGDVSEIGLGMENFAFDILKQLIHEREKYQRALTNNQLKPSENVENLNNTQSKKTTENITVGQAAPFSETSTTKSIQNPTESFKFADISQIVDSLQNFVGDTSTEAPSTINHNTELFLSDEQTEKIDVNTSQIVNTLQNYKAETSTKFYQTQNSDDVSEKKRRSPRDVNPKNQQNFINQNVEKERLGQTFSYQQNKPCSPKLEREQMLERQHIDDLKEEVKKLQDLVVLLRNQQQLIKMLDEDNRNYNISEGKTNNNSNKDFLKILDHPNNSNKNEDKPMFKSDSQEKKQYLNTLAPKNQNPTEPKPNHVELEKIKADLNEAIVTLGRTKKILALEKAKEEKFETELMNQKVEINLLKVMVDNLYRNNNKTNPVTQDKISDDKSSNKSEEIVGGPNPFSRLNFSYPSVEKIFHTPKQTSHRLSNLSRTAEEEKDDKPQVTKQTARDSDLSDIEKLLDTIRKEDKSKDSERDDLEQQILELEKQLTKKKKQESSTKELLRTLLKHSKTENIQSKSLEDDNSVFIKRLQKAIKAQSKIDDDDDEDIGTELKTLQNAINSLQPKEDFSLDDFDESEPKVDDQKQFQLLINKLVSGSGGNRLKPTGNRRPKLTMQQIIQLAQQMGQFQKLSGGNGGYSSLNGLGFGSQGSYMKGINIPNGVGPPSYSIGGGGINYPGTGSYFGGQGFFVQPAIYSQGGSSYSGGGSSLAGGAAGYSGAELSLGGGGASYSGGGSSYPGVGPSYSAAGIGPSLPGGPTYTSGSVPFYSGSGGNYGSSPSNLASLFGSYSGTAGLNSGDYSSSSNLNTVDYSRVKNYAATTGNSYAPNLKKGNTDNLGTTSYPSSEYNNSPSLSPSSGNPPLNNYAKQPSSYSPPIPNAYPQPADYSAPKTQFFPTSSLSTGYNKPASEFSYTASSSSNQNSDKSGTYSSQTSSYLYQNVDQKVDDLKTQIYNLQNVINSLNRPEYSQKPEDKTTIYNLEHQINDLKNVINSLTQDNGFKSADYSNPSYLIPSTSDTSGSYDKSKPPASYVDPSSYSRKSKKKRSVDDSDNSNIFDKMSSFLESYVNEEEEPRVAPNQRSNLGDLQVRLEKLKEQLDSISGGNQIKSSQFPKYGTNYVLPHYENNNVIPLLFTELEERKKSKRIENFVNIVSRLMDKIVASLPVIFKKLFWFAIRQLGGYSNGEDYDIGIFKNLGVFGYIPMLILRLVDGVSYFVNILKRNKFFSTILVPILVLTVSAGSVLFLIWWMQPNDQSNDYAVYSNSPYYYHPNNVQYSTSNNNYYHGKSNNNPVYSRSYFDMYGRSNDIDNNYRENNNYGPVLSNNNYINTY